MHRAFNHEAVPMTALAPRDGSPQIESSEDGCRSTHPYVATQYEGTPDQRSGRRNLSRCGTKGTTNKFSSSLKTRVIKKLLPPNPHLLAPEVESEFMQRATTSLNTPEQIEQQISRIIDDVKENPLQKQIDVLRNMLESLTLKRLVKAKLMRSETQRSKQQPISLWKRAKYSMSMSCEKTKQTMKGFLYSFELWYGGLKTIEGHLGSGVATYFSFLRWLFLMNSVILIISLGFLVIPQILMRFFENSGTDLTYNGISGYEHHREPFSNLADLNGTPTPLPVAASLVHKSNPYGNNAQFVLSDLFTGEGFLTHTSLYYGYYSNKSMELVDGYEYNIPSAYFFSMFSSYLLIFITLSASMARSYRKTFIETSVGQNNIYALKLFCGWDFSIATTEAAALNKKRIYNEIKEVLDESRYYKEASGILCRFSSALVKFALNSVFLLVLVGIGFLMWDLLGRHSAYLVDQRLIETDRTTYNVMLMSVFISIVMNVFPMCFSWIVQYEDYNNPRTALYVTLFRTFLLDVVVIGVLLSFWLQKSEKCWETSLGQEVYRLIITDFIISILLTSVAETFRHRLSRKIWKGVGQPEFDISRNTLNLVYNQALFWVGFYFSPLLAAVIVLKLFITFYVKKAGALHNCRASSNSWRAAQTQTVFLIFTFITLLGVLSAYGYILVRVQASDCGPFRGYPYMYQMILGGILKLEHNHLFWKLMVYMVKPGVVGSVLVAMSAAVYYLHAKSQAHSAMVNILRNMWISEARDKEFLLKYIDNVDRLYRRKGSPALSKSSSFRTPLSTRKITKTETFERDSVRLSLLSARRQGTQDWLAAERLHLRWQKENSSSRNSVREETGCDDDLLLDTSRMSHISDGTSDQDFSDQGYGNLLHS